MTFLLNLCNAAQPLLVGIAVGLSLAAAWLNTRHGFWWWINH